MLAKTLGTLIVVVADHMRPKLVITFLAAIAISSMQIAAAAPTSLVQRSSTSAPAGEMQPPAVPSVDIAFEKNLGQAPRMARFLARSGDQVLSLARDRAIVSTRRGAFELRFVGGDPRTKVVGVDGLPGKVNHFRGPRSAWVTAAPTYARVVYRDLYPGIDLVFHSHGSEIEYDFILSPGADPSAITLEVRGGKAALEDGALVVRGAAGTWRQSAPVSFQKSAEGRVGVRSAFRLPGRNLITFDVGRYNLSKRLTIDPRWELGTVFGGSGIETGQGLALDKHGYIYVAGETWGLDYPVTPGAYQTERADVQEGFLTKLDPTGRVVYSTYVGGLGWDAVHRNSGLAVDQHGAAYIAGFTYSPVFPTTPGAYDRNFDGPEDAYVAKLDPTGGSLVYSTFIGGLGGGLEGARSLLVDNLGQAYVSGITSSVTGFPLVDPLQSQRRGVWDGFIVKLNASGSDLLFSTLLGGTDQFKEDVQGIALAPGNRLYTVLMSDATDLHGTVGQTMNPGKRSLFVAAIDHTSPRLEWGTWIGGTGHESDLAFMSASIAVDHQGNVYAGSTTESSDIATTNGAYQATKDGVTDVFVTKLSPDGGSVLYSTYIGGSDEDRTNHFSVDAHGALHIVGKTWSPDLFADSSVVPGLEGHGGADGFALKLAPEGDALIYGAFLGGPAPTDSTPVDDSLAAEETALIGVLDPRGDLYVTGVASSPEFPTTDGSTVNGLWDAYVIKISD